MNFLSAISQALLSQIKLTIPQIKDNLMEIMIYFLKFEEIFLSKTVNGQILAFYTQLSVARSFYSF